MLSSIVGDAPPILFHSSLWSYLDFIMQGATQTDIIQINVEISRIIKNHLQALDEGQIINCDAAEKDEDALITTKPASALSNLPMWRFFDSLLAHLSIEAVAPIKKALSNVIKTRLSQ